jgi:D-alanine-D-alanine ligase
VTDPALLLKAIKTAAKEDPKVLVEAGIKGREIECAVSGDRFEAKASTLGEIKMRKNTEEFYDYKAKYFSPDAAELIVDPVMDKANKTKLTETAVRAFQATDCEGLARVDMFLTPKGEVYLNEINTLPGFTSISMYPTLRQADGTAYSELIDELISEALSRPVNVVR